MGLGSGGSTALRGGNRFADNVNALINKFPVDGRGLFGTKGRGRGNVRNIASSNPARKAAEFVGIAATQYVSARPIPGKGTVYRMRDGGYVTYRLVSTSDGSPVVELNVNGIRGVKNQKIHFTKGGR